MIKGIVGNYCILFVTLIMFLFKNINTSKYRPLKVTNEKKKGLTKAVLLGSAPKEVSPILFLVFHLGYVRDKYGIDIRHILTILYLKELGVFNYEVQLYRKKVHIKNLIDMGIVSKLVVKRRERNKYILTPYGNEIVEELMESIRNNERFVESFGQGDSEREVLSALNNYFD